MTILIRYTNHRGEYLERHVEPSRLYYGSRPPHYPGEPRLLLDGFCQRRQAFRTFDLASAEDVDGSLALWLAGYNAALREASRALGVDATGDEIAVIRAYLDGLTARIAACGLVPPKEPTTTNS